jgi:hypothetical protein
MSSRYHPRAAGHDVEAELNEYDTVVRPVTAKHNVANGEVEGVEERFRMAELRVPVSTGMEREREMTNWRLQTGGVHVCGCGSPGQQMQHCVGGIISSVGERVRTSCCLLPECSK